MSVKGLPEIINTIYDHPDLTPSNLAVIAQAHQRIHFKKGHVFLENGQIANEYFLIQEGLVRAFVNDFNGNEITTEFYGKDELLIEVSSLFQRIPTQENSVALTDVSALRIEFETFQKLYHRIPAFNEWGRAWMSNQLFNSKLNKISMLTRSASERYLTILNQRPQIIREAPLKYIASYLGVTDTSLSRIRKEIFSE